MLDRLMNWMRLPGVLRGTGLAVVRVAFFVLMVGAVGQVAACAPFPRPHQTRFLAELLPGLHTWWVPESVGGFLFVGVIAVYGVLLAFEGRRLDRLWRV